MNLSRTARRCATTLTITFTAILIAAPTLAAADPLPAISEKVEGLSKAVGFFPFYWDAASGKLYLEIPQTNVEFLYVNSLRTGLGSNPVGLDRGQLGRERVVKFVRVGPRMLLIQPNLNFRAVTDSPDERRAVEESFAQSVLWGGEVVAEEDGRALVDFTGFLLRDAHDVSGRLDRSGQGSFSLDTDRSVVDATRCKGFPRNTELEALLTFAGAKPGEYVRETTPTPEAITLWQRHSLIELPDNDYTPRAFDTRAGLFWIEYADYATPIDEPLIKRFINRHRLSKQDPAAAQSPPVEPIVYYVDRGAPEPVRQALLDGARWWNQAFEAAGYVDAFRVEIMPEGADPLDVRYNVIQWVHRSTRGWSYGGSVTDPRTGEIIKGHVSLGSLRVRQDRLLLEGLAPRYNDGSHQCEIGASPEPEVFAAFDPALEPNEVALARIRQLSAHEVGHTLGLAHNFTASTYGRESVMDYPAPLAELRSDGSLDLSQAYDTGIGEWDKIAVRYAYTDFAADVNQDSALEAILTEAQEKEYLFISDADSRSRGSAHPLANLWDNGADPVAELSRLLNVRHAALERFGEGNIKSGRPLAELENALVPLYLSHRYQIAATAKSLGGVRYSYQVRGDGQSSPTPVEPATQRAALEALLRCLSPEELALPQALRELIPPQPYGYYDDRELFAGRMNKIFDPLALAEIAGRLVVAAILQPERALRMCYQSAENTAAPSFSDALSALAKVVGERQGSESGYTTELRRRVESVIASELIALAGSDGADPQVRALATAELAALNDQLTKRAERAEPGDRAHFAALAAEITRFMNRPHQTATTPNPLNSPPGSPIGER